MSGMLLSLSGVTAGYGGGNVLQGVDLDCAEGTVTCVVGPNGAGKSTVLRVISGLLRLQRRHDHDGRRPHRRPAPDEILRRGITQVPQSQALFPSMTVRENVLMGGFLLRRRRSLLARAAGAGDRADPDPQGAGARHRRQPLRRAAADGGDRPLPHARPQADPARRALARAWTRAAWPAVAELIQELHAAGTTVLLVEQNVRLGLGLATHGVVMEGGKVRLTGTAAEVRDHPEMATLYLGGSAAAAS